MTIGLLRVLIRDDVLLIELNRPEKRNALSRALLAELRAAFEAAASNPGLRLAIVRGAGDKSFAAGGDLRELDTLRSQEDAALVVAEGRAALNAVRAFPVPVLAVLNGDALGGGAELAMACDFRVAAPHARLGFVQGRLNIPTAWGGGIDLIQKAGTATALRLLARAEILDAEDARRLGLVDAVAAPGAVLESVVDEFSAPIRKQAPHVLRAFKALALEHRSGGPRQRLEAVEAEHFTQAWIHEDHWTAAAQALPTRKREAAG